MTAELVCATSKCMQRLFLFIQFFPIAVFLFVSRQKGWEQGFQMGGLAAVLEFLVIFSLRTPISRILGGANLFLIFGGLSFYLKLEPCMRILGTMRESAIFISIGIVVTLATVLSKTGAFENAGPNSSAIRRSSMLLILFICGCTAWSYYFRGNSALAGTVPFVSLIFVKYLLQKKLTER
jgi:hypothetical protein